MVALSPLSLHCPDLASAGTGSGVCGRRWVVRSAWLGATLPIVVVLLASVYRKPSIWVGSAFLVGIGQIVFGFVLTILVGADPALFLVFIAMLLSCIFAMVAHETLLSPLIA
jgi:hypothetical protein